MSSPSLRGLWNECRATMRGLERWRCCMAFFSSAFLAFGLYHVHSVSGITEGGVLARRCCSTIGFPSLLPSPALC